MKYFCFLSLFFFAFGFTQDSQLYYGAYFFNRKQKPENFLTVVNRTSGIYEFTDETGFAMISAKEKDTLVWNNGANQVVVSRGLLQELKTILQSRIENTETKEILSDDYLKTVKRKENSAEDDDAENPALQSSPESDLNPYDNALINIKKINDSVYIFKRLKSRSLSFGGNFSSQFNVEAVNRVPETQNQFAQGFSQNGSLVWASPELGGNYSFFSFGPSVSSLGFDGFPYEYDSNGRLVPLQNSGKPALVYDNSLLKPQIKHSNFLNLHSLYSVDGGEKASLKLKFGTVREPFYFNDQFSRENAFGSQLGFTVLGFKTSLNYSVSDINATNSNRIGLFNRIFQNSLVTPVTFQNKQGNYLSNGSQRSFHQNFDNPGFLLDSPQKFNFKNRSKIFSGSLDKKVISNLSANAFYSYERSDFFNRDRYRPSIAFFANGIYNERNQQNEMQSAVGGLNYTYSGFLMGSAYARYLNNRSSSYITHSSTQKNYRFQRTTNEFIIGGNPRIDIDFAEIELELSNSFYSSNTSVKPYNWLPKLFLAVDFQEVWGNVDVKLFGGITKSTEEAKFSSSYHQYELTQFSPQNSFSYFPVKELETIHGLNNIDKTEWKAGLNVWLGYNRIGFNAEYFNRETVNEIFPVMENGKIYLKNIADHTVEGFDFSFNHQRIFLGQDSYLNYGISFYKAKDIVTRVHGNYHNHNIIGFSTVYKTLSVGEQLGSIAGTHFKRDNGGNLIVGADGFPIKENSVKIIGNPNPDFTVKINNEITFKNVSLSLDWEWRKGGQIWNGTQAFLDFYGRSASSAELRNVSDFIFEGVDANGNPNSIPVNFYDSNLDVYENRWARYGADGVADEYIHDGDFVRLNGISLSVNLRTDPNYRRTLKLTGTVSNIYLWRKYKGVDVQNTFFDTENGQGLDFFNLPGFTGYSVGVSYDF